MQNISNIRLRFAFMLTVAFMAASCAKDDLGVPTNSEGHPVRVTLNMGMGKSTDIVVTRADNSYSDLGNLYLFVYGSDGKYQQMLSTTATDSINLITVGTRSENDNGVVTYPITINTTSGTKNLLAVANTSAVADEGGFWSSMASIAEIAAAGNLSFDQLKAAVISLREDLYKRTEMLPIQIVSSTQMLISGVNKGVVFDTKGNITNYGPDEVVVKMDRAMARITFNIAQTVEGAKGTFVPSSYRVYNIPTESVLTNTNKSNTESDTYINSASMTIGNVSGGNYTFSFYMPENIPEANKNASIATYQDRDKWSGDKGSRPEKKTWTNAPQNSTFVVISGTYSQSGDTTDTTDKNSYTGNVSYTIHLGDFSNEAWSNFNVERNYSYTYKMSVKGVDNIVVETEKDGDEKQPGAEGQIFTYDASTYSYELDAHYEQVFLEYNLSTIAKAITTKLGEYNQTQSDKDIDNAIADNLILVIQSEAMDYTHAATDDEPYTVQNKRGTFSPYRIYANAVRNADDPADAKKEVLAGEGENISPTKGFDYKWVEFWPQTGTDIAAYPGVSEWSREDLRGFSNEGAYGGTATTDSGHLKDVYDVIVAMGKVVKKIYKGEGVSIADRGEDGITITQSNNDYVARFTAFVNEYYYYRHPLTGMKVTSWSVMTNKIPREMIIAMSSSISQDGNSSYSQIYSYITQASIQTFYNSRVSDINGFGIETYNETPHITFGKEGLNGLSKTDGRSNQITLIGGLSPNSPNWNDFIASSYNGWTKSVGSDRTTHKLSEAAYKTSSGVIGAYYACLSRNRDLNGNGVIDNNEIRWYLPSLNEYIRIGVGSNAISNAAQLYMGDKMNMERSTPAGSYNNGYPTKYIWDGALYYTSSSDAERVYWAVERGSSSADGQNWGGGFAAKPIRCIRSLPANAGGSDVSTVHVASDASYVAHNVPGTYGYVSTEPTVLEFKGRLVDELYRERTDGVLGPHNEDDKANSFYDGVFVAKEEVYRMEPTGDWWPTEEKVYIEFPLKQIINYEGNQINPCASYSEDGDGGAVWRVPNLAEFSAMVATGLVKSNDACCTQFSNMNVRFGFVYGSYVYCPGDYVRDGNSYKTPTINTVGSFKVRCVRDVPEGYVFPQ